MLIVLGTFLGTGALTINKSRFCPHAAYTQIEEERSKQDKR